MQIVEVKNNLIKVSYNTAQEDLILSGFLVIKDESQSFIAQIIHLEANSGGNFVIAKFLFNFDSNGVITNYNGSIPDVKSYVDTVNPQELLELLPVQNPIYLGELAQQKTILKLDRTFLEEKLLICSEKDEDNKLLSENLAAQLAHSGKKLLVIDLLGNLNFSQNRVVASEDFKLPLNYETINFIYEKGLEEAKAQSKATVQEVFLEVQNYVKDLPEKFIPFNSFKSVVDEQYQQTNLVDLLLLKNKLLKYYEDGVFAQDKDEFNSLKISLKHKDATILDLSKVEASIQREMISYAYSLISQFDKEIYVIVNVDNSNSDKKLLKQIFTTKMAYSSVICAYSYKYLKELKQLSRNLVLFAPIQQQNDFPSYNAFLSKLNVHEFVVYGHATHHLPLIIKLSDLPQFTFEDSVSAPAAEPVQGPSQDNTRDLLDEQIKRDVDGIYSAPKAEQQAPEIIGENDLTEDDLDFIDDLNIVEGGNISDDSELAEAFVEDELNVLPDEEMLVEEPEFIDNSINIEIEDEEAEIEVVGNPFNAEIEETEEIEEIAPEEEQTESVQSFSDVLIQQEEEQAPPSIDILPASAASTPVPIYSADIEPKAMSEALEQGDTVMHAKYGKGVVEKLINYGSKTLCSIHFDNVGRRLLDPTLAEIKKVNG